MDGSREQHLSLELKPQRSLAKGRGGMTQDSGRGIKD